MYKVWIKELEALKKQLMANSKLLEALPKTPYTIKVINGNKKQIKLLTEEYFIE